MGSGVSKDGVVQIAETTVKSYMGGHDLDFEQTTYILSHFGYLWKDDQPCGLEKFVADENIRTNSVITALLPAFTLDNQITIFDFLKLLSVALPTTASKSKVETLFKALKNEDDVIGVY